MTDWPAPLERLRGTVGIWTAVHEALPPGASGGLAAEVEALGYAAMWIPESWGREAFTNAGLLLSSTSTRTVATGIANIWARDAVAAVNATKTLSAAYDDRFVLGLGVSHQPLVNRLRGHDYATPVSAMRDYLTAIRAAPMLAYEGDQRVSVVIAALGPRMLELGAALADGVHPYLVTPEHVHGARGLVGDKFIGVEQAVVLGGTREDFLIRAHDHLEHYTGLENYRNSWRRLGFDDSDFVRGGSERLCDAMVVHGDESVVRARIDEYRTAGADHVCLQLIGESRTATTLDEWRRLAPAVTSH